MIKNSSNKQISKEVTKNKEFFMFPANPPVVIEAESREEAEEIFKKLTSKK